MRRIREAMRLELEEYDKKRTPAMQESIKEPEKETIKETISETSPVVPTVEITSEPPKKKSRFF